MCRHMLVLWLAACAHANTLSPLCVHPSCQWRGSMYNPQTGEYDDVYTLDSDGNQVRISAAGDHYRAECSGATLGHMAWPHLDRHEHKSYHFTNVTLVGCKNDDDTSYAVVMQQVNVTMTNLHLLNVPLDSKIGKNAFSFMPSLRELTMMVEHGVLVLLPEALEPLNGLKRLELRRVRPDLVPPNLDEMEIFDSGLSKLALGDFNGVKLNIMESELHYLTGSAPRLQTLKLQHTRRLYSLTLHHLPAEILKAGMVQECPALEVVELRHAQALELPKGLLRDVQFLTNFTYTHGLIRTLPDAFFNEQKRHLRYVDLSDNLLEALTFSVLSGMEDLQELRLANNRFTERAMALALLRGRLSPALLDLSGNPLGDLCPPKWVGIQWYNPLGRTSMLELSPLLTLRLQVLNLANTGAKTICADWLGDFTALRYIDLRGNNLEFVQCKRFRFSAQKNLGTVYDLRDNPLDGLICSMDDSEGVVIPTTQKYADPYQEFFFSVPKMQMKLVTDNPSEQCMCECAHVTCVAEFGGTPNVGAVGPNLREPVDADLRMWDRNEIS